jgi:hypothetical protein
MGPECKDPLVPDVDLRIIQLNGEGIVRATGSRIHPHCLLPLSEGWSTAADKGPQKVCTYQPGLLQLLDNLA